MKLTYIAVLSLIVSLLSPLQLMGAETIEYDVKGLQADAEIRIDHWGVPHNGTSHLRRSRLCLL